MRPTAMITMCEYYIKPRSRVQCNW